MKVLLDHCLDWRLGRSIVGHDVKCAGKLRWGHLKDPDLLTKAQGQFDLLVTSDKNLPFQQNLARFKIAVVILDVPSNRLEDCLPKIPLLLARMHSLRKGRALVI